MDIFEKFNFYRGMSNSYPTDRPYIVTPRKNRRPLNTDERFHMTVDEWFYRKFGTYYRSQSVFLTSNKEVARTYSYNNSFKHVVRVIPLNLYKYCWSPKVDDLYNISIDNLSSDKGKIESMLDSLEYKESGLIDAVNISNEIMLSCCQYVAIPLMLNEII